MVDTNSIQSEDNERRDTIDDFLDRACNQTVIVVESMPRELFDALERYQEKNGELKDDIIIAALAQYIGFQL